MTTESISSGAPNTPAAVEGAAPVETQQSEPVTQVDGTEVTEQAEVKAEGEKVVPDEYKLELPEGAQLPEAYLEDTAALAKEYGLTQEQAAALVERDAKMVAGFHESVMSKHEAEVSSWAEQVKADPELGGEKFNATQEAARAAVARFGDDGLRQWLNDTGFGNHPMAVKFFAQVGKAIADDRPNLSGQPPQGNQSPASILYPSSD